MSAAPSFLHDVVSHFQSFAKSRGVNPDDVHVRFFLADGSSYIVRGLKTTAPAASGGWGLIESVAGGATDALAVREQHIVKIELAVNPGEPTSIGLHTEAAGN